MNSKARKQFQEELIRWYVEHQRTLPWRKTDDPYHIWVSEVMLQQTQVNTVLPYYHRFLRQFPTLQELARADLQDVLKAWEGLGYYARARNLHKAAHQVMEQYNGLVPHSPEGFRKLPGVGDYISAAVQSIAFHRPLAVVDGNVKRVLSRLFEIETPVNASASHKMFLEAVGALLDSSQPGTFNQAMMELGAMVCKPRQPSCAACPVCFFCMAHKNDHTDIFPKRTDSASVPEYQIAVGVVRNGGRLLIVRRKPDGLLGGLWEFPGGELEKTELPEAACVRQIKEGVNIYVQVDSRVAQIRHAYTHFKIRAEVFLCNYVSGEVQLKEAVDYKWIYPREIEKYPFPKANHKFFSALLKKLEP